VLYLFELRSIYKERMNDIQVTGSKVTLIWFQSRLQYSLKYIE
jgi:hypothetical protein